MLWWEEVGDGGGEAKRPGWFCLGWGRFGWTVGGDQWARPNPGLDDLGAVLAELQIVVNQ